MKRTLTPALRLSLSSGLCAAVLALAGPAAAEDSVVIKCATVAPTGTPWSALMDKIKGRVKKRANAEASADVKVKVYYGGKLGGEKETIRETREGRVQMWGGSTAALATIVPELYALEAPFLFDSSEEADFVLDKFAKEPVKKLLADRGFVFYQWSENGWHGLASKKGCITSLADLKDQRIRSQEAQIHLDALKAMGANAMEMAVPEVLEALKTGRVDGFSNTPLFSFATSWYQGIEAFSKTEHMYQPAIILYSKKWFDAQPKAMQDILLAEAAEDQAFSRGGVRSIRDGLLANFTAAGKKVCDVPEAGRAEMKKATSKIFGTYKKKYAKTGKALFDAIEKGKAEWAKTHSK
jgi:TRAP-type C4-dicarboxylate transport system substrate-binding protein